MDRSLSPDQELHLRRLMLAPRLDSQLPWIFANKASVTTLTGTCPRCQQVLDGEQVHGHLREHSSRMVIVDAVVHCPACGVFQGMSYRIFDDLHLEGMGNTGWSVWRSHRIGWRGWLQQMFG